MRYQFDFSRILDPVIWLDAIGITLSYAIGTILCGLMIGVVCGILLLSPRAWLRAPINFYVQFFRCTPLLVQIVWFYYALPILTGVNIPATIAAGLGLTLYMGAFCSEIFRGGVISIDKGQWNAARALGMSYLQMMRYIILPQAARRMVPPFVNQSVLQLKNTSLLYVVAVPDIMYTGYEVTARTYRPLEVYTFVALIYFAILYPATLFAKRLESRYDR
jgi:polar amino acid transport system permease protein